MNNDNIVLFKSSYFNITGDHLSAMFLAQLEYWQPKSSDGWVIKSVTDWWNELRVTKKQVTRIKAELESLGYIQTKLVMWKHSQTTAYYFKKSAVELAVQTGFNALEKPKPEIEKHSTERAPCQKGIVPKGNYPQLPKVPIHSNLREPSILENIIENTIETTIITEKNSAQLPLFFEPDTGSKKTTKKPKQEKKPVLKHEQFSDFKSSYLNWYKQKFGMAHTFSGKEAGILGNIIDRLKQVTEADETSALLTFQAMLTNWDQLSKYNREKPQLNLLLSNLNSICNELKQNSKYDLDEQKWLLECDAKKGRHHADFAAYLKWYNLQ
jgi:hypothetical protein